MGTQDTEAPYLCSVDQSMDYSQHPAKEAWAQQDASKNFADYGWRAKPGCYFRKYPRRQQDDEQV
jgi:hypothetical protein